MRMPVIMIDLHNCTTRNPTQDPIGVPRTAYGNQLVGCMLGFDEDPRDKTGAPVLATRDLAAPMLRCLAS